MLQLYARVFRFLLRLLLGVVVSSLVLTLAFRWLPLPGSALMLIRAVEHQGAGKPIRMNYRWVSLAEISPQLQRAAIAAEDQRFYTHWGFDLEAIEKAVEHNKISKTKRGASTISQQTAKNLFLWPGRSWLRKALEAYFTVVIELLWPKERILEVYLNIAEWGDGIYGAEAAAREYFNKPAEQLTLGEASRLAACLPSPRKWSPARPNPYVLARAGLIAFKVKQMEVNGLLQELGGGERDGRSGNSADAEPGEEGDAPATKRRRLPSADEATGEAPAEPPADSSAAEPEAADGGLLL